MSSPPSDDRHITGEQDGDGPRPRLKAAKRVVGAAEVLVADPSNAAALAVDVRQRLMEIMASPKRLQVEGSTAAFYVHSVTEDARIRKFREPWTIDWLRGLPDGAVLYDVGANIGITSLLAVEDRSRLVYVVAIEPAPANFASLVKNVQLNEASDRVYPLAIGLGAATAVVRLKLTTYEPGGAMHSFGEILQLDADRQRMTRDVHHCLCVRLDGLTQWPGLPFPTHIKIDVDGGEWDVVSAGRAVLGDPRVRAVQIEIADADASFGRSRDIAELMAAAGLFEVSRHPRHHSPPYITDCLFSRR